MTQILKGLTIPVTGSTPTTPPSGFGTLYASQSTGFFYKNPSGTNFNLLAPNGFTITRYYTGSATGSGVTQTYLWSKPPGNKLRYIEVCCVGAGGGGGSGRKSTPSAQGGAGGGGGAIVWGFFDASTLSSSYTITIGAGGDGGAGVTTSNTSGNTGTDGGTSSFGRLVIAMGGDGGLIGAASAVRRSYGGYAVACTPAGYPHAITGCNGGTLNNVPANPSNPAPNIFDANPSNADTLASTAIGPLGFGGGGGGVGGAASSGGVIASGSRGSGGYQFTTLLTGSGFPGTGSTGQNASPPSNNLITTLLQFTGSTTIFGLGGGGHGGAYSNTVNAGNGSNGGLYGAGGGGGGALGVNTALSSSGAGGSGSSGLCIVVEFY